MSRPLVLLLALLSAGCEAPAVATPRTGQDSLLLRGAVLVDVVSGVHRPGTSVLMMAGRISAVGPDSAFSASPERQVLDAGGKYLVPGFIDSHVHLFPTWGNNWPDSIAELGWILASGVTTIREAGGGGNRAQLQESYLRLREAADSGRIMGPHIVVSAQESSLLRVTGAASLEEAFGRWAETGFDQYKIMSLPRGSALEQIRLARQAGVSVWGHHSYWLTDTTVDEFGLAAIEAGISGLTHGGGRADGLHEFPGNAGVRWDSPPARRAEAALRQSRGEATADKGWIGEVVRSGAWWEPTLAVSMAADPLLYGRCTPPIDLEAVRTYYPYYAATTPLPLDAVQADSVRVVCERRFKLIRSFQAAGGKVLAGTDEVPFAPLGVPWGMNLLVLAGLSPLEALQAGTLNSAEALGIGNEVGRIEPGLVADLVLLQGDPLQDISNVYRVSAVISRGRIVDRGALLARHGTNPPMWSPAEIDNSARMSPVASVLAHEHPDSTTTFGVVVNELYRPEDLAVVGRWVPVTIGSQAGDTLWVTGPAYVMTWMTGLRFVREVVAR